MPVFSSISSQITLPKFSGDKKSDPGSWLWNFENYVEMLKLDEGQQKAAFAHHMTGIAEDWLYVMPERERDDLDGVKAKFKERFYPSPNLEWKRESQLYEVKQREDQPVLEYITAIEKGAKEAGPGMDRDLRNLIISGLLPSIQQFVQVKEPKDLNELKRYAKRAEDIQQDKDPEPPDDRPSLPIADEMSEMVSDKTTTKPRGPANSPPLAHRKCSAMKTSHRTHERVQPYTHRGKPNNQYSHSPTHGNVQQSDQNLYNTSLSCCSDEEVMEQSSTMCSSAKQCHYKAK